MASVSNQVHKGNENEQQIVKKLTGCHLASLNTSNLVSETNKTTAKAKTVIVQMSAQPVVANFSKLKSLMPQNVMNIIPKTSSDSYLVEVTTKDSHLSSDKFTSVPQEEVIVSQSIENKPIQEISITGPVGAKEIINILQHLHDNLASSGATGFETRIINSDDEQDVDKTSTFTIEPVQDNIVEIVTKSQPPSSDAHTLWPGSSVTSEPSSSQTVSDEIDKEQDIVRKTVVEAFVKMVVCRKLTVQKVNTKTGQILDTKVKMEEEEPVILGVDCVETTEDLIATSAELATTNSCNADSVSPKWGTSLDGGLKFLSAVSESRQKIGKSIIKDKVSTPQKETSSKFTELDTSQIETPQTFIVESASSVDAVQIKAEPVTDSDSEWNEDMNDDSEDYVPGLDKASFIKSKISTRNQRRNKESKTVYNLLTKPSKTENFFKGDILVLRQKKRGRKRKWDNALGMATNLRTCQFCNKHFNRVNACARHMKKGDCVSSIFCFICFKPFQSEQELENHLLVHRSEVKSGVFECKDCNRSYRTRTGYTKHLKMGTCSKRDKYEDGYSGEFSCDLCESRFSSESYLKLHRYKVHENPKDTHICCDCGKRFYSIQGFNKHRQGRPCTEPLKCHICGKSYSSKAKDSFKIHMKHHRTEVSGITFQCDECERCYMTQVALNKHKLSHTGVKPYKCNVCGKEFSMRYMVKDHARMHTGERPFLCSLCGGAFSNKGHLGRHLRSHESGTLLKRGRPKKIKIPEAAELKMIEFGQALHNFDGQTIQVVDGQMFENQSSGMPMTIQAISNTIIITEGWPNASTASAISIPSSQKLANVMSNMHSANRT